MKRGSKLHKLLFIYFLLLSSTSAVAQYYNTLPQGVRLFVNKYVQSQVSSSFNKSQSEAPYSYKIQTDIETLEKIDDEKLKKALALISPYQDAYNQISLGTHQIEANADVKVNAYALGYGITNKITAYVGIPVFDAKVNLDYTRVNNGTLDQVAATLQNKYGDDWAQTLGNIVENLYDIDAGVIQSGLVNGMGYEELGSWNGQGLGDTEIGIMYNFLNRPTYGFMLTVGTIAPTGYVDDPDIIQDIGFGDGQWDAFMEFGGGKKLNSYTILDSWLRYTYQFSSEKTLRIPYSSQTNISDRKGNFNEKLGNKLTYSLGATQIFSDWFSVQSSYLYNQTEKARYESEYKDANKYLAQNTESHSHNIKLMAQLSSVKLFQQEEFMIPAKFSFSYQQMISGKNTPKADILELEFRMFF